MDGGIILTESRRIYTEYTCSVLLYLFFLLLLNYMTSTELN